MEWFLLFLGLFLATLAGLLPAPTPALVCKILAVVVFGIGMLAVLLTGAGLVSAG